MIVPLLQELIRIPSENNGITGYENEVQTYYWNWLRNHGIAAELIYPENIPDFDKSIGRLHEHSIRNRPLVVAVLEGKRPGKTLLLLAHADTVPVGPLSEWSDSPFSGKIENGRIYGRGSGDDKWGMAVMGGIITSLNEAGRDFCGRVIIASVPDEESGGGNGTAALFAHGITADEAIFLDGGSNQTIWHAGLGGGGCRIAGEDVEKIRRVIFETKEEIRKRLDAHPCFCPDFFKIIEKQFYSVSESPNEIRFFYDTLYGDNEDIIKAAFELKLQGCRFQWMSRFLKPAFVPADFPLVTRLADSFRKVTGRMPPVTGGIQSDQGLVMMLGHMPCILFGCGRRGMPGASHLPNEFIELKALEEIFQTFLYFVWTKT